MHKLKRAGRKETTITNDLEAKVHTGAFLYVKFDHRSLAIPTLDYDRPSSKDVSFMLFINCHVLFASPLKYLVKRPTFAHNIPTPLKQIFDLIVPQTRKR